MPRLALALLLPALLLVAGAPAQRPASAADDEVTRVIQLTNAERQKAGLPPLVANTALAAAAQEYALVLTSDECWAHTCGPEPDFARRADNAGYAGWSALAENIAVGQPTPEAVVASWMRSDAHRQAILSVAFSEIGVGIARGGSKGVYWTQEFGARGSQPQSQPVLALNRPPELEAPPEAAPAAEPESIRSLRSLDPTDAPF